MAEASMAGIFVEPRLTENTTDFNVDPNAPFLGGGVNPSSYGNPDVTSPPPQQRPSQFKRMGSIKRWMPAMSMPRITRKDEEQGYLSDTTMPASPETTYTVAPQPIQQPSPAYTPAPPLTSPSQQSYYQVPQASPARRASASIYQQPGNVYYQSQNLRTPSSHHQTAPQSEASASEEDDVDPTLVNHAPPVADVLTQSAVNLAPDYAKMEEPKHPPHGVKPSRVQQFFEALNKMPWISKEGRITVDYFPNREKRPDIPYNARNQDPNAWYSPVVLGEAALDSGTIEPFPVSVHGQPQMSYIPTAHQSAFPSQQYPQGGYASYQPAGPPLVQGFYPSSPTDSSEPSYPNDLYSYSRPYPHSIPPPP
ncbi:hypothetical protein DL96DRAFT_1703342 [Flagelloscypha sp. PMI_526]|nr:hypothetical protein DL96DRAFT_1703342 [Flagelloscypha sp. PMI_526]